MKLANSLTIGAVVLSLFGNVFVAPDALAKKSKNDSKASDDAGSKATSTSTNSIDLKEASKPVDLKDMVNVDALNRWMTYYYLHPQPDLLVAALLLADKQGLLQGDAAPPMQAFASRVMAQNPSKVRDWYLQLAPISNSSKTLVLTAMWWSNTKESKEVLDAIAANLPDKAKAEFHKQIDSSAQEIDKMEIESPDLLDMLWACFCATGDEKYVRRLASTLTWSKQGSKDLAKMMIASSARWSIISNIKQHPRVKEICEKIAKEAEFKPYMESVLAAASGKPQPATASTDTAEKEGESSKDKSSKTDSTAQASQSESSNSGTANGKSENTENPVNTDGGKSAAVKDVELPATVNSSSTAASEAPASTDITTDGPKPAKEASASEPATDASTEAQKTKDNQVAGSDSQSK